MKTADSPLSTVMSVSAQEKQSRELKPLFQITPARLNNPLNKEDIGVFLSIHTLILHICMWNESLLAFCLSPGAAVEGLNLLMGFMAWILPC